MFKMDRGVLMLFSTTLLLLMLVTHWTKSSMDRQTAEEGRVFLQHEVQHLQHQLDRSLFAPYALATLVRQGSFSLDHFEVVAEDLIKSVGGINNLQLAPDGVVNHIYPLAGNEGAIGHNLLSDEGREKGARAAIERRDMILVGPVDLIQGGRALIARMPIFITEKREESFWGFSTVLIDMETLQDTLHMSSVSDQGFEYRIISPATDWGDEVVVMETAHFKSARASEFHDEAMLSYTIAVPGNRWILQAYRNVSINDLTWLILSLLVNSLISLLIVAVYAMIRRERRQNRKIQSQLLHAQRLSALGTLAGGVAHEFNNILAAIAGHTELALLKIEEGARDKQHLEVISSSTERARELVQKIMTFSRNEVVNRQPFDLGAEVQKALYIARATIPSSVSITDVLEQGLPEVMGDPRQVHQVLQNLLNNAHHAIRDSGRHGEISVHLTAEAGLLHLSVSDNGSGMSNETLEHIFDPFYTTKEVGEGTGLGMSVVHGIVTEHGGSIEIDTAPGEGTTVHVMLPAVKPDTNICQNG